MKKTTKKPAKKKIVNKCVKEKIHEDIDSFKKVLNSIKLKYDKMDDKTKKNIAAGIIGSTALIAGLVGVSKMKKKKERKK
jgi:hypothetical protein